MSSSRRIEGSGPFNPTQVRTGDRYELSNGHAIYCAPTGGDGAGRTGTAFAVIDSDPDVERAGVDPGFTPNGATLRAPDIAVGVPDAPGWIDGAPPLAVEYAGRGQDEDDLRVKIGELLAAGTRFIWVVRLTGPRRVEVHTPHAAVRTAVAGEVLEAPGVLRNPVPVLALFDREAAYEATLTNLMQRRGFASLDAALAATRDAGREEGREEGQRVAEVQLLARLLAQRFGALDEAARARLEASTTEERAAWSERLFDAPTLDALLGQASSG